MVVLDGCNVGVVVVLVLVFVVDDGGLENVADGNGGDAWGVAVWVTQLVLY